MSFCFWRESFLCLLIGLCVVQCSVDGRACNTHEECGFGFYCNPVQNACLRGCRFHIECDKGQVCQNFQCYAVQEDKDQDGFPPPLDCDDQDPLVKPEVNEICGNQKDDNCNGQTDEQGCLNVQCAPGQTRECYEGKPETLGAQKPCKKGVQQCTSQGLWGFCQGQQLPNPESCDGQDNDCDGNIDNQPSGGPLTRRCYDGSAGTAAQ
ncbi:MAG: putative metal-binding motif-containing protein, partial [Myxococcota bacterium]